MDTRPGSLLVERPGFSFRPTVEAAVPVKEQIAQCYTLATAPASDRLAQSTNTPDRTVSSSIESHIGHPL